MNKKHGEYKTPILSHQGALAKSKQPILKRPQSVDIRAGASAQSSCQTITNDKAAKLFFN